MWNLSGSNLALKVAARRIQLTKTASDDEIEQEEQMAFSQAIHYANRMVYVLIPLDSSKLRRVNMRLLESSKSLKNPYAVSER